MLAVKVLPKGQITLPKAVRKTLHIEEGDTLILESQADRLILKKGKTIFDFIGILPSKGMTIDEIREKAIAEAAKEHE
jgi:AbrB family looped-hinge helix DNA binding protein